MPSFCARAYVIICGISFQEKAGLRIKLKGAIDKLYIVREIPILLKYQAAACSHSGVVNVM